MDFQIVAQYFLGGVLLSLILPEIFTNIFGWIFYLSGLIFVAGLYHLIGGVLLDWHKPDWWAVYPLAAGMFVAVFFRMLVTYPPRQNERTHN